MFLLLVTLLVWPASLLGLEPSEVFQKVSPSVVVVRSMEVDRPGIPMGSQGSGVVIAPGKVITNFHVVNHAPVLKVEYQGGRYDARLLYADQERDLAQLEVPDLSAPAIEQVSYHDISTGDQAFTVGAPQGLDLTLSQGLISSIRKKGDHILIQTSAAISKGSSGGGLFDEQGRLVGITTMMVATGQNLNFAVPSDWIADLPARSLVKSTEEGQFLLESAMHKRKGAQEKLVDVTTRWLEKNSQSPLALSTRGDAFLLLKRYDLAAQDYQKLYSLKGLGFEALRHASYKGLGDVYAFLHRYHASIKAYARYIELLKEQQDNDPTPKPQNLILMIHCLERMAFCFLRMENYEEAMKIFQRVEKMVPPSPAPLVWQGRLHAWSGNHAQAVEFFKRAMEKAPDNPNIHYELGIAHAALGRPGQAIEHFRATLEHDPWKALAQGPLGEQYLENQRHSEALAALREAVRLRPAETTYWYSIGKLLARRKDHAGAADAFDRYLQAEPLEAGAWARLGRSRLEMKSYREAAEALERANLLEPGEAQNWYLQGVALAKSKQLDSAIPAFEEAVRRSPKNALMLYKLGLAAVAQGDRKKVIQTLRRLKTVNRKAAVKLKRKAASRGLLKRRKR